MFLTFRNVQIRIVLHTILYVLYLCIILNLQCLYVHAVDIVYWGRGDLDIFY